MSYSTRYRKPNMASLPYDLGKAIFEQILSTPKLDEEKLEAEARKLEDEIVKIRKMEDEKRKTEQ